MIRKIPMSLPLCTYRKSAVGRRAPLEDPATVTSDPIGHPAILLVLICGNYTDSRSDG